VVAKAAADRFRRNLASTGLHSPLATSSEPPHTLRAGEPFPSVLMAGARASETTAAAREAARSRPNDSFSKPPDEGAGGRRNDIRFLLIFVVPLLALTFITAIGAWVIFRKAYPDITSDPSTAPTGGVILLVDAKAPGIDPQVGPSRDPALSANVTAEMWITGYREISELMLKMRFVNGKPGTRWYIVASGQYFPDPQLDSNMFCDNATQVVKMRGRIRCRNIGLTGSKDIEYRYNDRIGSPFDGKITAPLDSVDGYDARSAAIITGVIGSDPDEVTRVFVPHHTPLRQYPGGDHLVRLAPVLLRDDGEYGSGTRLIGAVADDYRDVHGRFGDVESGQVLRYLPISRLDLEVSDEALSSREIASVRPPTVRSDELIWSQDGEGITQISYRLHDPYAQDRTAAWIFGAGLLASVGAAALLLLFEQILVRRYKAGRRA
jgi:hypothetical protein